VAGNVAIWASARVSWLDRLYQGGALKGSLSGSAPQTGSLLDQASLGAVSCQNLWLVLSNVGEVAFQSFSDPGM
jgi:hypothetical protein